MYTPHAAGCHEALEAREDLRIEDVITLATPLVPGVIRANALRSESVQDLARLGENAHHGAFGRHVRLNLLPDGRVRQ